jgi:phosphoribosylanthranilate isomerase
MKIKVCGITDWNQMQQLQQMDVDYCGMIFYEGSKRFVGNKLENQQSEIKKLKIKKVGVFVNADYETVLKAIDDYGLTAVQLHGDETDEFCLELTDKAKVIKVFRIADQKNIDELIEPFQNVCHYFLFDTAPSNSPNGGEPGAQPLLMQDAANTTATSKSEVHAADSSPVGGSRMGAVFGGTGKQFDWSVLQNATINKPFFLSGGIGLEDAEKVKAFRHPYFFATDVNSCFETTPGIKDMKKVQQFINAFNNE